MPRKKLLDGPVGNGWVQEVRTEDALKSKGAAEKKWAAFGIASWDEPSNCRSVAHSSVLT
jgi:hypothetical protein